MAISRKWLDWKAPSNFLEGTGERGKSPTTSSTTTEEGGERGESQLIPPTKDRGKKLAADLASADFKSLLKFKTNCRSDRPPLVNDVCARAINRLQGWEIFKSRMTSDADALLLDFGREYEWFMAAKLEGRYLSDRLPVLKCREKSTMAERLNPEAFSESGYHAG